jgi:iron complex outermembrane receptor protein
LEYNRYDYDNRTGDGSPCTPAASACRFYRPADREDSFTDYALNLGASYRLRQGTHAYMRLAQGFRAPQVAELYRLQSGQQVADLDSEELRNLELGLRGSGDAWQYSVAAFLMHKREVIFQDADRQNVSGAKTRHYGLELEADYRFAEHWSLDVDLSLARHQYDSAAQLLGASGDIEGNDIDTAPRVFGSARLSRELPAWRSRAGLEWVYMGSYYLEPDNEHEYDGHSLLNLRLQGQLNDTVALSLRLTNLLDEDYAERADFGFGNYRYFVGQPRGAYVELTFSP